jgi:hypothetical protein
MDYVMINNVKDFSAALDEKLKHLSKEERAKAGLKKLAQEMETNKDKIKEPDGLASGASDSNGKMILDLDSRSGLGLSEIKKLAKKIVSENPIYMHDEPTIVGSPENLNE